MNCSVAAAGVVEPPTTLEVAEDRKRGDGMLSRE